MASSSSTIPTTIAASQQEGGTEEMSLEVFLPSCSRSSAVAITGPNIASGSGASASTAKAIHASFREKIKDPRKLDDFAEYLYNSLLTDAIAGVFIEIHHLHKTGNLTALDGEPEEDEDSPFRIVDVPDFDIFGEPTVRKSMDCTCPSCDRPVAAARFAPHLEKCMGMGRVPPRVASRRLATKEASSASSSSSSYLQTTTSTGDEDDVDWSPEKGRKKSGQGSRSASKKKNVK